MPTPEQVNLYDDGMIDWPSFCQDCSESMDESLDFEYMSHSDADPGL